MKLGLSIGYSRAHLELPVKLVQRAEELGYDSVWTAEAYGTDAVTPLAYLAALTKRIKLGTGIMQLAARTPANAAMMRLGTPKMLPVCIASFVAIKLSRIDRSVDWCVEIILPLSGSIDSELLSPAIRWSAYARATT